MTLAVATEPSTNTAQHSTGTLAPCALGREPCTFVARAIPLRSDLNNKSLTILLEAEESPGEPLLCFLLWKAARASIPPLCHCCLLGQE